MPDLDTRIAEIAGRAEAATSEEWRSLTIYPARAEVLTGETHQKIAVLKGEHCYEDADFIANARSDIPFLLAALQQAREALREADKEASLAHDAIWHESVQGIGGTGIGRLHDNDDPLSAQSAIWRLHNAVRAALAPEQTKGTA